MYLPNFRYCSRYGKRLDFNSSFQRTLRHMEKYEPIVRRMIDEHDGPKIRFLKLDFIPTNDVDIQVMAANWINKAAQKVLEEPELNFGRCLDPFRVTFDLLFQIKTLEVIHVKFVDLGMPINDFQITKLRFLKVSSMNELNINVVILNALLRNCIELEIVEIIDCNTPDRLRLSAGNLNKSRKLQLANYRALEIPLANGGGGANHTLEQQQQPQQPPLIPWSWSARTILANPELARSNPHLE
ncbi:FBD-associated F-box protein At1g61320 [Linum grandiflorum]